MPLFKEKASSILGSVLLVLLAAFIIAQTFRDVSFYFDKTVLTVNTPIDVDRLHDNAVTEISIGLDLKRAYGVRYLTQREFLLIPFSGLGYKLMYVVEGPLSDKLVANFRPPYKGRVVTKDFADDWDVYDQQMNLKKIFARDGIELPSLWIFFLCTLSI